MTDRTPPQDTAAEQSVLGGMMLAARVIPDVEAMLRGADYYRPAHETIHETIVDLYRRGEPVDPVTVADALSRRGELQRVGGAPYLHTLTSNVPTPDVATHYAGIVLDKALRRRLMDASSKVAQLAQEAEDATEAAQTARSIVDLAAESSGTLDTGVLAGDAIDEAIDWLEAEPETAATPWADVNERTNGLLAGAMVTVAARPGHGKSLCLKDVALFTAMQGKPVHIATLEMTRNEYLARIICGLARIDLSRMLRRELNDQEWAAIGEAADTVRGLPLYLDDRERQSMAQIRAAARQTQRKYGALGLVGIDYCQLVQPAQRLAVREQEVAQISRDTKLMAKEFQCPVMLLAQLNRNNQQRMDPTPRVSDLRESGALEQDSDQVWLLHRPDQYGEDERLGEVDLIVGKNRNGPAPITIPLAFVGHRALIASLA